ncbi:hypothetical protein [Tuwongella immobilis]|uniref:Uncharacterized protein n=1 Tax=Tuwongella immobilis TaxID=692036 RepID=A0A6C2YKE9_9BACT|nr:hypothetical protein [Tuwongella immobilis]VIP01857.1 unnamed protein product [Tuwongella immobilis]VTR99659.1 unnamed protein product [Tuwongella immobilis]
MGAGVQFDTWGVTRYPTRDGRALEVSAGEVRGVISLRYEYRDPNQQPTDAIACEFRTADSEGRLWAVTSRFTTQLFVTHMFDFAQNREMDLFRFPSEGRRFKDHFKNNTLDRYRVAFRDHLLLADARYFSDDRSYRNLAVAGRLVQIKFKYLHLSFDVAGSDEDAFVESLSVRIANHCFWDEERDYALGPMAFDIQPVHFLRHNTGVWDAVYNGWRDSPFPMPLVFSPVEGEGKPQGNVRLVG